ncbi:PilN domain-containing protein [Ornithinibacillus halotolerans]|uniref:Tfp pilus assembly protein PilN n=1 Tax=Ornithinibacillus halotolerans TaxID=1274357 RepID=A0A916WB34_9BACI|nr:PilN domain-containing protein [Ornithinibacillus halotolerans]GGA82077.1 hypothetical protein GCM10008025_26650 [Ornithinibacillus halotolerans]
MLPEINLLPKIERQSSVQYIVFLVGLILFIVLSSALIYFYLHTKNNLEEVNQNISQLEQEKTLLETRLANLDNNDDTNAYKNAARFVEYQIIPTSSFIDELLVLLPETGYLSNYTYSYQGVQLETQFENMTEIAAYVEELNGSELIDDVQVNQINTFELENSSEDEEDMYSVIPRYTVSLSIKVNDRKLVQGAEGNE